MAVGKWADTLHLINQMPLDSLAISTHSRRAFVGVPYRESLALRYGAVLDARATLPCRGVIAARCTAAPDPQAGQ